MWRWQTEVVLVVLVCSSSQTIPSVRFPHDVATVLCPRIRQTYRRRASCPLSASGNGERFLSRIAEVTGPFRPVQSRRPELAKSGKSREGGKLNPTPPTTKISMGIDESQQIRTFSFTTTPCNILNSNNLNISIDLVSIRLCRLQRLSPKPYKLP
jgi:hypothetical protein